MERTTKPVRMDFPRLGYFPMKKNYCVIACLVGVARFYGLEFEDQLMHDMFEKTGEQRGLDDENLNDWLASLNITARRHVNCTLDDIRKALKTKTPCAVGYQVNSAPSWHPPTSKNHLAVVIGINHKYLLLADITHRFGQVPYALPIKDFVDAWWSGEREPVMDLTINDPENIERGTLFTFQSNKKIHGRSYESIWMNIKATDEKYSKIERKDKKAWLRRRVQLDEGGILDTLEIDWDRATKELEHRLRRRKSRRNEGVT